MADVPAPTPNPASVTIELHEIPYLRLFPWLRLFRSVGVALDGKKMILAAIGLALSLVGWGLLDILFPGSNAIQIQFMPDLVPSPFANADGPMVLAESAMLVADPPLTLIAPFREMFLVAPAPGEFWHGALAAIWTTIVWGIIGGAIARIAVVQVARGERVGLMAAVRFALRKASALILAPLTPLLGVAFLAALCAIMGLGYQIRQPALVTILGIFAFLPLLAGLVMAMILVGLAAGWPLMHATIAAETEDVFDALSRSYAYVYQRPGRYAAYVALSWVLGTIGLLVVAVFARAVESLAIWGLSFGAPDDILMHLFRAGTTTESSPAVVIHTTWIIVVRTLAYGWVFAYFWTAISIIYLLLRHDVDGTDWTDIMPSGGEVEAPAPPSPSAPPPIAETQAATAPGPTDAAIDQSSN